MTYLCSLPPFYFLILVLLLVEPVGTRLHDPVRWPLQHFGRSGRLIHRMAKSAKSSRVRTPPSCNLAKIFWCDTFQGAQVFSNLPHAFLLGNFLGQQADLSRGCAAR